MDPNCESHWEKMIGKPYMGKLYVRFDKGGRETGPSDTAPVLYSTGTSRMIKIRQEDMV